MARSRMKRRWVAAGVALGGLALAAVGLVVAGTRTVTTLPLPGRPEDGSRVALVRGPEGSVEIRGARVVDASVGTVFAVLTDYPAFPRMFAGIDELTATPMGSERYLLTGFGSVLGWSFPLRVEVEHLGAAAEPRIRWDQASPPLQVNRGSWTLAAAAGGGTLVVYRLEVAVEGVPSWLVRQVVRSRLGASLDAVAREAGTRRGKP